MDKFCTNCLYNGIELNDCYTHYPGEDCPSPVIRLEDVTCTRCEKKGHLHYKCTVKQCRYCKENRHLVKDCEKLAKKLEAEQNRWCTFCEEYGHTTRFCENPHNIMNVTRYCYRCRDSSHGLKNCSYSN